MGATCIWQYHANPGSGRTHLHDRGGWHAHRHTLTHHGTHLHDRGGWHALRHVERKSSSRHHHVRERAGVWGNPNNVLYKRFCWFEWEWQELGHGMENVHGYRLGKRTSWGYD